jgi:hypothetical protein
LKKFPRDATVARGSGITSLSDHTVWKIILSGNFNPPVRLELKFETSGKITPWKMKHLSSGLSVTEITSRLEACEFSQRDIRALLHESGFMDQIYRNHQLCFLDAWWMKILGHQLCTSQIAFIFNMNETTVRRTLKTVRKTLLRSVAMPPSTKNGKISSSSPFKNKTDNLRF